MSGFALSQVDPGRHFKISPLGHVLNLDDIDDVDDDVDERVLPLDLVDVSDAEIVPESSPDTIPVGNINFFPSTPEAVPESSIASAAEDDGNGVIELANSNKENLDPAIRSMVFRCDVNDHHLLCFLCM